MIDDHDAGDEADAGPRATLERVIALARRGFRQATIAVMLGVSRQRVERNLNAEVRRIKELSRYHARRVRQGKRQTRCSGCGKAGHNIRTCEEADA